MSRLIRKLYVVSNYREAYYQLPPTERGRIWQTVAQNETSAGATVLISCDSQWCDESVVSWGIIEYPSLQAVQKATALHELADVYRYVDVQTFLGLPVSGEALPQINLPDPLYQLFIVKNAPNEPWASLQADARDHINAAMLESMKKNGGIPWTVCDVEWSNEECNAFGVIVWPNIEAVQAHVNTLKEIGWHRYMYARTILGTKSH